ncbi:unnamed protein product, partial [Prorocentrum cordatum]
ATCIHPDREEPNLCGDCPRNSRVLATAAPAGGAKPDAEEAGACGSCPRARECPALEAQAVFATREAAPAWWPRPPSSPRPRRRASTPTARSRTSAGTARATEAHAAPPRPPRAALAARSSPAKGGETGAVRSGWGICSRRAQCFPSRVLGSPRIWCGPPDFEGQARAEEEELEYDMVRPCRLLVASTASAAADATQLKIDLWPINAASPAIFGTGVVR